MLPCTNRTAMPALDDLFQKVWDGHRISMAEARLLYGCSLTELGILADRRRSLAKATAYGGQGNRIVTYIVDRNINYTNICTIGCKFCAFYRRETDPDAYVISFDELDRKIEETIALGGTQILLQGGHHPKLRLEWYLDMLSHIKSRFPEINIHGFSPNEIVHLSRLYKITIADLISLFKSAGLGSIPGGGAEILVDRIRTQLSPGKATADQWFEVMDIAHRLGLNTSATMMFGHIETIDDRLLHLDRVRQQQDKTKGFTAFICWTFQPANTRLLLPPAGAHEYLRTQALSRIYLDNFENVQSSWVTQGPEVGQIALKFGANDLGSIMIEENVVAKAGAKYRMSVADMHRLICDLGYDPRQRDNWYRLVDRPASPIASST
jgi:cyclic dehypoxanthinyl futalosine synthase